MNNKLLDFANRKIVTQADEELEISSEKEEILKIIEQEGLWGFFGLEKPEKKETEESYKIT